MTFEATGEETDGHYIFQTWYKPAPGRASNVITVDNTDQGGETDNNQEEDTDQEEDTNGDEDSDANNTDNGSSELSEEEHERERAADHAAEIARLQTVADELQVIAS